MQTTLEVIKSFYPLKLLRKIYLSVILFAEKGILNFAASGAFYFLLSVIPVALIFVTVLDTYLAGYGKISNYFFNFLSGINPEINKEFFEQLGLMGAKRGKVVFGIVGAASLIWSSTYVFSGMKSAFNIIFNDGEKSSVIISNLVPFIFVPLLFVLSVILFAAAALFSRLHAVIEKLGIKSLEKLSVSHCLTMAVTLLFIFAVTFCLYRFLPSRRPANINAFTGAVLFTASTLLIQTVFYKIVRIADYYLVYGVISVLIAGLFWVYILFALFYLFAQFVYVQYKFPELEFVNYYNQYVAERGNFIEKCLFRQPAEAMERYGVRYQPGKAVIEKGGEGGYLYILISGKALSDKGGRESEIKKGGMFGESGVLAAGKYEYNVKTVTECLMLKLPKDFYDRVVALQPRFLQSVLNSVVN